ncbi:hypothetical protein CES85_3169 (plasmid) [Ochrobactrum quorumnocens]|uniref:Uncharacterized protein n=1 Tax=Ochrobactrum quorumnocens TaxID=271865 RepID=A0A248UN16_9HYPH|nr:hypothetical protein CES85_3169 [[Ochrobactrum] quorumnocens]
MSFSDPRAVPASISSPKGIILVPDAEKCAVFRLNFIRIYG